MTLTNHLKKTIAGLGLLGILAGCGSGLPPARAHTDVYSRADVSPQLKRSNALYDIRAILGDSNCVEGWEVSEQGIYCEGGVNDPYTNSYVKLGVRMSWEEVKAIGSLTIDCGHLVRGGRGTAGGCSLYFNSAYFSPVLIRTTDRKQAEQLKYSIEQYLRYRNDTRF
ncbi:MAG: hypothetical protein AABX04_04695 [Nanoarchaeota archaeon]